MSTLTPLGECIPFSPGEYEQDTLLDAPGEYMMNASSSQENMNTVAPLGNVDSLPSSGEYVQYILTPLGNRNTLSQAIF
jgi:hypothetical protein